MITTSFQEDNIFGMNSNLTYGPQFKKVNMSLINEQVYTVCTERVWSPYAEHAARGLSNPTSLVGEVLFEPPHGKTDKMTVRPAKTGQPGHPPCLIRAFAVRSMGS